LCARKYNIIILYVYRYCAITTSGEITIGTIKSERPRRNLQIHESQKYAETDEEELLLLLRERRDTAAGVVDDSVYPWAGRYIP